MLVNRGLTAVIPESLTLINPFLAKIQVMEKSNPKALNLDILKDSISKVTLGFKCCPSLKLNLATEAQQINVTLSEYVENIVANYDKTVNKVLKDQKSKIAFYENDVLKELFELHKQKTIEFVSAKGEKMSVNIESIQDVFTVMIHTFKSK